MAKWTSGHYGHSQAMKRGNRTTERFPRCGQPECPQHLLECAAKSATQIWTEELNSMTRWMMAQGKAPAVQQSMLEGIAHWQSLLWSLAPNCSDSNQAALAVVQQNQIGWDGLFFGRLAAQWEVVQHLHWK